MELRKVEVKLTKGNFKYSSEDQKLTSKKPTHGIGYFHRWYQFKGEHTTEIWAIVELENGTVEQFEMQDIRFLDKPDQ